MSELPKPVNPEEVAAAKATGPALAMILLETPTHDMAQLAERLKTAAIGPATPGNLELRGNTILFNLDGELTAISLMPGPMPWSDLRGPCSTAWMWPEAEEKVSQHKGHLLLAMMKGQHTPIQRRLLLTELVAALARETGVVGIFWPEGTLVHSPELFTKLVAGLSPETGLPLWLWIDFRIAHKDDGSICLFTTGLKALGHLEIEAPEPKLDGQSLRELAFNIAHYLLENGPVLKDGNTLGISETTKLRVHHRPSMVKRAETVIQLEWESEA